MPVPEKSDQWRLCQICQRAFPDHLLSTLVMSQGGDDSSALACPLCALRRINKVLGVPLETPFRGKVAQVMHDEAVAYVRSQRKKGVSKDGGG